MALEVNSAKVPMNENIKPKLLFLVLMLASCFPFVSAPMALVAGIAFGITAGNPWGKSVSVWTKRLLQISVVGLGFGMNLPELITTGKDAFLYTAISISLTMACLLYTSPSPRDS